MLSHARSVLVDVSSERFEIVRLAKFRRKTLNKPAPRNTSSLEGVRFPLAYRSKLNYSSILLTFQSGDDAIRVAGVVVAGIRPVVTDIAEILAQVGGVETRRTKPPVGRNDPIIQNVSFLFECCSF